MSMLIKQSSLKSSIQRSTFILDSLSCHTRSLTTPFDHPFVSTEALTGDTHKPLRGRPVAKDIYKQVQSAVQKLQDDGWQPRLNSITIGDSKPMEVYVRNQKRVAERNGIIFEETNLSTDISRSELLATIGAMNVNPHITGIIIQRPVPDHLCINEVQQAVHPLKDVEGMHPASLGNVVYNDVSLAPCTAKAAVELLKQTGLSLPGLQCVVVGHSEIVGKPISFLLMSEGCTVTICHHMTRNLATHTRQAEVIFVAVGKPGLITGDMIKPGAAVIDIGINSVKVDGEAKIVGDADYSSCLPIAGWITPVPGGVGVVTTAILMQNTVAAAQRQQLHYEATFGPNHVATNTHMMSDLRNSTALSSSPKIEG